MRVTKPNSGMQEGGEQPVKISCKNRQAGGEEIFELGMAASCVKPDCEEEFRAAAMVEG